ncbi:MAG: hypothetical protein M0R38_09570 [Bacteroidia bacterium]|nr:hypothetical protein [Bacteroidia bacterium]
MAAENTAKSRGKYWLFFLLSVIGLVLLLMYSPAIFWFALPPGVTSLALAMDWI